ncbi:MAG: hypothetical protein L3J33_03745 [Rhodobacteraceae bacterium]|nr:hypothetical protein [Paracoccaceae bacterium]
MGRDKRNEQRVEKYAQMILNTMQEPAWRALPASAQALYPWVKLEWRGPKANNNGKIQLSVRQAAQCLGMGREAAAKAFHDLQAKGFLAVTQPACLGLGGAAQSPMYEITEIAMPAGGSSGRKMYRQWKPLADFPVSQTLTNNPKGSNGRQQLTDKKGGVVNVHKLHR